MFNTNNNVEFATIANQIQANINHVPHTEMTEAYMLVPANQRAGYGPHMLVPSNQRAGYGPPLREPQLMPLMLIPAHQHTSYDIYKSMPPQASQHDIYMSLPQQPQPLEVTTSVYPDLKVDVSPEVKQQQPIVDFPICLTAKGYVPCMTTFQNMSNCKQQFGIGHNLYQINPDQSLDFLGYLSSYEIRETIMHHFRDEYASVTFNGIPVVQYIQQKKEKMEQEKREKAEQEEAQKKLEIKKIEEVRTESSSNI